MSPDDSEVVHNLAVEARKLLKENPALASRVSPEHRERICSHLEEDARFLNTHYKFKTPEIRRVIIELLSQTV